MEKRLYESRKTPNVIRSKIKRAPIYDWGYVTGTRRVVLDTFDEGGFYGNNAFRENTPTSLKESSTRERRSTTRLLASLTMVRPS